FFFASRRRHTRSDRDWSSDVCSSDLTEIEALFRTARDADYGEIVADAQRLLKAVPSGGRRGQTDGRGQMTADLNRLKRRLADIKIGRASCRERGKSSVVDG